MTCKGTVRGKTIELEQALPQFEGKSVYVSVEPTGDHAQPGSPAFALKMMDELEHLDPGDIDELERLIEEGKQPVNYKNVFDEDDE